MKPQIPARPIVTRLLRAVRTVKGAKVVDLRAFRQRAERAADLQKTVAKREDLADLHPAHARYVYMQNQISVLFEQLTALPETRRLADRIEAAQDEYVPSGPPMSPLTTSYFTCWAFFDAAVSPQRETIGTCIVGLGKVLGMHPNFIALVQVMQDSCMRIYVHESFNAEGATNPRDLVSGARISCIVLSGWRGLRGEVWLARVFPPQVGTSDVSVVFTTPYVLPEASEHEWGDYFDRTLGAAKGDVNKTTAVLKYVIDWSEYIFAGYAGHATEAVFLKGLPDVSASLPHYSPRTR